MQKVKYVDHIFSEEGIKTDPGKVQKMLDRPIPHTQGEIGFVGFIGYYGRFIPNFSKISEPLREMMPKSNNSKDKKHKQKKEGIQMRKRTNGCFSTPEGTFDLANYSSIVDYDLPFE